MSAETIERAEFRLWADCDDGLWSLQDDALGLAWSVAASPAPLAEFLANVLVHNRFRGSYVQLIGSGAEAEVLVTLKGYVPVRGASFGGIVSSLLGGGGSDAVQRWERWEQAAEALRLARQGIEFLLERIGLESRRIDSTLDLDRVLDRILGSDLNAPIVAGEAGLTIGGEPRSVVSILRRRSIPAQGLESALGRLLVAPGDWQLSVIPEPPSAESCGRAHGFVYPTGSIDEVEEVFGDGRGCDRFTIAEEGPLALFAALWATPFGPEPRLESVLEAPQAHVSVEGFDALGG